jgi:hypothetical protein
LSLPKRFSQRAGPEGDTGFLSLARLRVLLEKHSSSFHCLLLACRAANFAAIKRMQRIRAGEARV